MIILILYFIVAVGLFVIKNPIYNWYRDHSPIDQRDDADGNLHITVSMFWPFMVPFAIFAILFGEKKNSQSIGIKIKAKYQVVSADYAVTKIIGTYDSHSEAMEQIAKWVCIDHVFSIRKVFTVA